MMNLTHIILAAGGTSFVLGDTSVGVIGLAIMGSQLPDLDTSTSVIGRIFWPVSHYLEGHFPHRSITHSLLATGVLLVLSIGILKGGLMLSWKMTLALPLGHLIACYGDMFTKQGVQWFYPSPKWCVHGANPKRRITTGSLGEYWVLAGAIAFLMFSFYIVQSGGLLTVTSQKLGIKGNLIQMYNQNAHSHYVWAEIKGTRASDRAPVNGRYLILGVEGSDFMVTDGRGIYQTDKQIIPSYLTTTVGEPVKTQSQTLTFNHQQVIPILEEIAARHPKEILLLHGKLEVTFPEEIHSNSSFSVDQFPSLSISGKTVTLAYHPLGLALQDFDQQYATGTLTVQMINPIPQF